MVLAHNERGIPLQHMRTERNEDGTWSVRVATDCFFAYGLHGQVILINPAKRVIAVYLGNDRLDYFPSVFYRLVQHL